MRNMRIVQSEKRPVRGPRRHTLYMARIRCTQFSRSTRRQGRSGLVQVQAFGGRRALVAIVAVVVVVVVVVVARREHASQRRQQSIYN